MCKIHLRLKEKNLCKSIYLILKMYYDDDDIMSEHGAVTHNETQGKHFLGSHHGIALIVFISAVMVSQFWYQTILELSRYMLGVDQLQWWQLLIISIIITIVLYFLIIKIFKIPFASIL